MSNKKQIAQKDIDCRLQDMHNEQIEFEKYVEQITGIDFEEFMFNLVKVAKSVEK